MALSQDETTERMRTLLQEERAGARISVELGPWTAMMLIGTVEWAMQRREFGDVGAEMYAHAVEQLRTACASNPTAAELVSDGA